MLEVMQKLEQAAFQEAIQNGQSLTEAVREVAHRMDMFVNPATAAPIVGVSHK